MILCNLYGGGRAALYDLKHLKSYGIGTIPFRLPEPANDRIFHPVTVLPTSAPRREP